MALQIGDLEASVSNVDGDAAALHVKLWDGLSNAHHDFSLSRSLSLSYRPQTIQLVWLFIFVLHAIYSVQERLHSKLEEPALHSCSPGSESWTTIWSAFRVIAIFRWWRESRYIHEGCDEICCCCESSEQRQGVSISVRPTRSALFFLSVIFVQKNQGSQQRAYSSRHSVQP